jgi:hypothetical protein
MDAISSGLAASPPHFGSTNMAREIGPHASWGIQRKRVVAFNTAEKWSADVSEDVAWEVLRRVSSKGLALPASTRSFCAFHIGLRETALAESARI